MLSMALLSAAGRSGTPQMVAPGAADILDLAGWQEIPEQFHDRAFHQHNRLVKSVALSAEERRARLRDRSCTV